MLDVIYVVIVSGLKASTSLADINLAGSKATNFINTTTLVFIFSYAGFAVVI
jgi:hypothetical protein